MALPLLLIAAAAAAQSPPASPPVERLGRPFMSPMGEPVFGRTAGEDGLVAWFQQVDTNHDGSITVDEMEADADRFFQTLDTNHDGQIDPDEITHYEQVIAPEVHTRALMSQPTAAANSQQGGTGSDGHHGRRGHGGGGGFEGFGGDDEASAGLFGLLQIPEPVASADENFDRGVSADEFRHAAQQRFELLDVNHTGRLTLPELEGVREAAISAAKQAQRDTGKSPDAPLDANSYTQSPQ